MQATVSGRAGLEHRPAHNHDRNHHNINRHARHKYPIDVLQEAPTCDMLRRLHQFAIFALVSLALVIFYWRDPRHQLRISLAGTVDTSSLFLAEEQCAAAFPGLFDQVDNAEAGGRFDLKRLKDDTAGLVQGRIKDGKVCLSLAYSYILRYGAGELTD